MPSHYSIRDSLTGTLLKMDKNGPKIRDENRKCTIKYILLQLYEYKSNDYRSNTNPRASELIVKEIGPKFTFVNPSISPFFFLDMAQFRNGTNKTNST